MATIVRAEVLQANLPPMAQRINAIQTTTVQETPIVRLVDSDGIVGVGYCWTRGTGGSSVIALLRDHFIPRVLGVEPDRIDAIWQDLFRATHALSIGPISSLALAAVDVALWDLVGKREQRSLWRMAGGVKERVPAYNTDGGWLQFPVSKLTDEAHKTKAAGFAGTKVKVGKPRLRDDIARLQAVREAVGSDFDVMVDANQCFPISEAVRRAKAMEAADISWFEEPLPAEDIQGHVRLCAGTSIPIAVGESLYHPAQFRDYFARGACTLAQPDVAYVGGITPFLKVAHMAEAFNIDVCPHFLMELSVSLACAIPNGRWVEYIRQLECIVDNRLTVKDGTVSPPDVPGTGIEWNDDAIAHYQAFAPLTFVHR
jgi:L-alanine-DL-glutamate epimerase-like enolase superfamily enzyme